MSSGAELTTGVTFTTNHENTTKDLDSDIPGIVIIPTGKLIIQARTQYSGEAEIPLPDLLVGVYDKSPGSCAQEIGIKSKDWPEVIANCTADYSGTTDTEGLLEFDPIRAGKYIIIGGDGTNGDLGAAVDIDKDQTVTKKLIQHLKKDKDSDPGRGGGKDAG
jgi:hypothetical protein